MNQNQLADLLSTATSAVSFIFCVLIFRTWLGWLRGDEIEPGRAKFSLGWLKLLAWVTVAGSIFSYECAEYILTAALAFLAGAAFTLDFVSLRDELRRSDGQPLRRVK